MNDAAPRSPQLSPRGQGVLDDAREVEVPGVRAAGRRLRAGRARHARATRAGIWAMAFAKDLTS